MIGSPLRSTGRLQPNGRDQREGEVEMPSTAGFPRSAPLVHLIMLLKRHGTLRPRCARQRRPFHHHCHLVPAWGHPERRLHREALGCLCERLWDARRGGDNRDGGYLGLPLGQGHQLHRGDPAQCELHPRCPRLASPSLSHRFPTLLFVQLFAPIFLNCPALVRFPGLCLADTHKTT